MKLWIIITALLLVILLTASYGAVIGPWADDRGHIGMAFDIAQAINPEPVKDGGFAADFALEGGNEGLAIAAADPDSPYFDTSDLSAIGRMTHWMYLNSKWLVPAGSVAGAAGVYLLGDAFGWWGGSSGGDDNPDVAHTGDNISQPMTTDQYTSVNVAGDNNRVTVNYSLGSSEDGP